MGKPGRNPRLPGGATQRLVVNLVDRLIGRPEQIRVMQQQHVRLERVGARVFRYDLAEQPPDGLEQHKAIAVRGPHAVLLQRFGDRRKSRLDFAEGQRERRWSHAFGRKSSSARTNSVVASTWGQCPTGISFNRALSNAASSREPAIGRGSNVPCRIKEGGRGTRDAVSVSVARRS